MSGHHIATGEYKTVNVHDGRRGVYITKNTITGNDLLLFIDPARIKGTERSFELNHGEAEILHKALGLFLDIPPAPDEEEKG